MQRFKKEQGVAGYVLAQLKVTDPEKFAKYGVQVPATIEKFGGRYLVRGGDMAALEGEPFAPRVVVIEFDSVEAARRWYDSEDYAPLAKLRQSASEGRLVIIEGYQS
jgi:uncharacterized protein (DUF1330 family)|tara:strand:- start:450 stop:770 length:321 start_codon:yes stop_codon:yes gene_type:complete